MISQGGLFSSHSNSPNNAIYLGRMETAEVPLVWQKTLRSPPPSCLRTPAPIGFVLNRRDVSPPRPSSSWFSVTLEFTRCPLRALWLLLLSQASGTVANCMCHTSPSFDLCVRLCMYVFACAEQGKTVFCSWKAVKPKAEEWEWKILF